MSDQPFRHFFASDDQQHEAAAVGEIRPSVGTAVVDDPARQDMHCHAMMLSN